jgi:bacillithiol system protein YtxJ
MSAAIRSVKCSEDVRQLLELSREKPVMIFKHSTRCPASSMAELEFEEYARGASSRGVECARVLVIEDRPVSNEIASVLGVVHQSPQAILVKNAQVVWNGSHGAITAEKLVASEAR